MLLEPVLLLHSQLYTSFFTSSLEHRGISLRTPQFLPIFPACLVHLRVGRLTFEIEQKKHYHPSHLMFIFSSDPFPFRTLPKLYCMLPVGLWRALLVSMAHTFPACLPPLRYLWKPEQEQPAGEPIPAGLHPLCRKEARMLLFRERKGPL